MKLPAGQSTNFEDRTGGSTGFQHVKDVIGDYLYRHQIVKGANGKIFDPVQADAYDKMRRSGWTSASGYRVPLDKAGRRADIDWGSNAGISPLMAAAPSPDQMARNMGFKNAAQALAYKRKQDEMRIGPAGGSPRASYGSLLDQALTIHPSKLLSSVLDKWNKVAP